MITGRMARAWVAADLGGGEVLQLVEVGVPAPGPGEVTIDVRAAGLNPMDYKLFAPGRGDPSALPLRLGQEVSGVITALGPDTEIASGGGAAGDEVLAFRVSGGVATSLTVPAKDVFAKPASLGFPEAANLLLVGTTALDMMRVTGVRGGETILIHGASGATGVSLLQQARLKGIRAIGTASLHHFDRIRDFGGEPVEYGKGLADRVRDVAPDGIDAAFDTVGTDEAVDVSLQLVPDRNRIVTIAAYERAQREGIRWVVGRDPESRVFRDSVRADLIRLAGEGKLMVPVARTFPFEEAPAAIERLRTGHPGGKLALAP